MDGELYGERERERERKKEREREREREMISRRRYVEIVLSM